ncbi:U4/U6 snRNP-specific spliceosomal protein [Phlyctochytrium arcticum]|nr:U4/U6 snRNP-specific spliceosomal protein [Phlyctochytrium arcticum]
MAQDLLGKQRVHYGSLEENERVVRGGGSSSGPGGGLTLDDLGEEDFEHAEPATRSQAEQQAIMEQFERKRIARKVAVPTDDIRVRARLREEGEPMTLFGEGPAERRDRLREVLARKIHEAPDEMEVDEEESSEEEEEQEEPEEEFYTPGPIELLTARRDITRFSISRAKNRLAAHRRELELPYGQRKKMRHEWYTHLKTFEPNGLQYGDERPLTSITFSPNSRVLATAAWSGTVKLWSVPDSNQIHTLKGHNERVSGLAFHPQSTITQSPSAVNLASGAADGSVHLWNFTSEAPLASLTGHELRVTRVAFHPSGKFVGTASVDSTWRLFDTQTTQELLLQEGHSREIFALGFQNDGALAATGGRDSIGRVWDLRTGRSIMVLKGHVKHILCLDWSPNGYHVATGSEDNSIRIWDMRAARCLYTVPAHTNIVSQVRYWHAGENFERKRDPTWNFRDEPMETSPSDDNGLPATPQSPTPNGAAAMKTDSPISTHIKPDPTLTPLPTLTTSDSERYFGLPPAEGRPLRRHLLDGSFLVSSSYDGTCKVWTDGDFKPVKSLAGLEGKVMGCDVSGDGRYIATASYDRTFKLYSTDESTSYED